MINPVWKTSTLEISSVRSWGEAVNLQRAAAHIAYTPTASVTSSKHSFKSWVLDHKSDLNLHTFCLLGFHTSPTPQPDHSCLSIAIFPSSPSSLTFQLETQVPQWCRAHARTCHLTQRKWGCCSHTVYSCTENLTAAGWEGGQKTQVGIRRTSPNSKPVLKECETQLGLGGRSRENLNTRNEQPMHTLTPSHCSGLPLGG